MILLTFFPFNNSQFRNRMFKFIIFFSVAVKFHSHFNTSDSEEFFVKSREFLHGIYERWCAMSYGLSITN
jgi:hypothetical protein